MAGTVGCGLQRHPMRRPDKFLPPQIEAVLRADWLQLMAEQRGLVTTAQLRGLGVTADAIEANVDAGRWQHVLPRVYATYAGPLPRSGLIMAAMLYAGPAALLSHRTAAEEWGMVDTTDGPIHVTVPYGCSAVSQQPWLVVHRSRAFAHVAVCTVPARVSRADGPVGHAAAGGRSHREPDPGR